MGEAAAQMSDEVIVTSDNPRSEDPARITLDVEVGVRRVRSDHYEIILDRETAIAKAFSMAQPDDIVLIAGKGHENYQILSDRTIPFDDREVARRLLESAVMKLSVRDILKATRGQLISGYPTSVVRTRLHRYADAASRGCFFCPGRPAFRRASIFKRRRAKARAGDRSSSPGSRAAFEPGPRRI